MSAFAVFLSHKQLTGGDQCHSIASYLERVGVRAWFDKKTNEINAATMVAGVEASSFVLLFLSEGVFHSYFVREELSTAIANQIPIVLVRETESAHGGVSLVKLKSDLESYPSLKIDLTNTIDYRRAGRARRKMFATIFERGGRLDLLEKISEDEDENSMDAVDVLMLCEENEGFDQCSTLSTELNRLGHTTAVCTQHDEPPSEYKSSLIFLTKSALEVQSLRIIELQSKSPPPVVVYEVDPQKGAVLDERLLLNVPKLLKMSPNLKFLFETQALPYDRDLEKFNLMLKSIERKSLLATTAIELPQGFDPYSVVKDKVLDYEAGTRSWILSQVELSEWGEINEKAPPFILLGGPGVGKSVVMAEIAARGSSVVASLSGGSRPPSKTAIPVVALHFFLYSSGVSSDPVVCIKSLALQLSGAVAGFSEHLPSKAVLEASGSDLETLMDVLIVRPASALVELNKAPLTKKALVIDAVDECDRAAEFAAALQKAWPRVPSWLTLIASSRPSAEIATPFESFSPRSLMPDDAQNKADVREYLSARLSKIAPTLDVDVKKDVLDELENRSGGVFLWIRLVRDDVERLANSKEGLTVESLKGAIPRGIEGRYSMFFEEFKERLGVERYRKVLLVLLASRAPVVPVEVWRLASGYRDVDSFSESVVNPASKLFSLAPDGVSFPHKSAKDWLIGDEKDGVESSRTTHPELLIKLDVSTHNGIARACDVLSSQAVARTEAEAFWDPSRTTLSKAEEFALSNATYHLSQELKAQTNGMGASDANPNVFQRTLVRAKRSFSCWRRILLRAKRDSLDRIVSDGMTLIRGIGEFEVWLHFAGMDISIGEDLRAMRLVVSTLVKSRGASDLIARDPRLLLTSFLGRFGSDRGAIELTFENDLNEEWHPSPHREQRAPRKNKLKSKLSSTASSKIKEKPSFEARALVSEAVKLRSAWDGWTPAKSCLDSHGSSLVATYEGSEFVYALGVASLFNKKDLVICVSKKDASIRAYKAETGALLWISPINDATCVDVNAPAEGEPYVIVAGLKNGALKIVSGEDGSILGQINSPDVGDAVEALAVSKNPESETVVVMCFHTGSHDDKLSAFSVDLKTLQSKRLATTTTRERFDSIKYCRDLTNSTVNRFVVSSKCGDVCYFSADAGLKTKGPSLRLRPRFASCYVAGDVAMPSGLTVATQSYVDVVLIDHAFKLTKKHGSKKDAVEVRPLARFCLPDSESVTAMCSNDFVWMRRTHKTLPAVVCVGTASGSLHFGVYEYHGKPIKPRLAKSNEPKLSFVSQLQSAHGSKITSVQFAASGFRVVSAADDGTIKAWDLRKLLSFVSPPRSELAAVSDAFHSHKISTMDVVSDGNLRLAVTGAADCAIFYRLDASEQHWKPHRLFKVASKLDESLGDSNRWPELVDPLRSGIESVRVGALRVGTFSLLLPKSTTFSKCARVLAVGRGPNDDYSLDSTSRVELYGLSSGKLNQKPIAQFECPARPMWLRLSVHGATIRVVCGGDERNSVFVTDVEYSDESLSPPAVRTSGPKLLFEEESEFLEEAKAAGSTNEHVLRCPIALENVSDKLPSMMAVASLHHGVRLYDASTSTLLKEFDAECPVGAVCFSPDNSLIFAAASKKGALMAWSTSDGSKVFEFAIPAVDDSTRSKISLAIGDRLASVTINGATTVFDYKKNRRFEKIIVPSRDFPNEKNVPASVEDGVVSSPFSNFVGFPVDDVTLSAVSTQDDFACVVSGSKVSLLSSPGHPRHSVQTPLGPPMSSTKQPAYKNFAFGGMSAMAGAAVSHPLDLLKVRLQVETTQSAGVLKVTRSILSEQGVSGLFKGLSASLLRQAVYSSVRFGTYDAIKEKHDLNSVSKRIGGGMLAGAVGASVGNPADVAMVRMQADAKLPLKERRGYRNVVQGLYRIASEEGVLTWWSGVGPTVFRAMIVTAAQFAAYDSLKEVFEKSLQLKGTKLNLCSAFGAGIVASLTSHPVDVVKTRLMNDSIYKGSPLKCVTSIVSNEGALALYKGLLPTCARQLPYVVTMFMTLEFLRSL